MTMRKPIDLSGEEDVYASAPHDRQAKLDTGHHEIRVVSDSTPTAPGAYFRLVIDYECRTLVRAHHPSITMAQSIQNFTLVVSLHQRSIC